MTINGKLTFKNSGSAKGVEKMNFFPQDTYHSQNFEYETLNSLL